MTDRAADTLRPEHVEANRLIDLAETGDREAYRAALKALEQTHSAVMYDAIKRLAARQYRMAQDHRFFTWRADWVSEQRARAGDERE
ncbi:hypothetical protein [Marinobacter sp.]|uniref:hypothetical protein n=1 Tax=Marinobacter sp. TaxID=50741 RepID=UPI003A91C6B2